MNFLTSYIDGISNDETYSFDRNQVAGEIMKEANYFALASHFFWAIWAINMATSTAIQFGYMV
jgi:hypothetical protein